MFNNYLEQDVVLDIRNTVSNNTASICTERTSYWKRKTLNNYLPNGSFRDVPFLKNNEETFQRILV